MFMGLSHEGQRVYDEVVDGQRHASEINRALDRIQKIFDIQKIDAIACSAGPGSYTGLRVGMSFVKALCVSIGAELLLINTLEILARIVDPLAGELIMTAMDARRLEVFGAFWDDQHQPLGMTQNIILDAEGDQTWKSYSNSEIVGIGDGIQKCLPYFSSMRMATFSDSDYLMSLENLALGTYREKNFSDVALANPHYGKEPFVTTPKKRF